MQQVRALVSTPKSPASEWRALLFMAVTLAQMILHLRKSHPRKALEKTEMLEAWCLLAVTELSHQITAEGPEANARKPFSEQLPPIYMILQMLLVFTQRVKAGLKAELAARQPYPPRMWATAKRSLFAPQSPYLCARGYFDSG